MQATTLRKQRPSRTIAMSDPNLAPTESEGMATQLRSITDRLRRAAVLQRTAMLALHTMGQSADRAGNNALDVFDTLDEAAKLVQTDLCENLADVENAIAAVERFWGLSIETLAETFGPLLEQAHDDARAEKFREGLKSALRLYRIDEAAERDRLEGNASPILTHDQLEWYRAARDRCGWAPAAEAAFLKRYNVERIEDLSADSVFRGLARDIQNPEIRDAIDAQLEDELPSTVTRAEAV